jgi:hypothetical protein
MGEAITPPYRTLIGYVDANMSPRYDPRKRAAFLMVLVHRGEVSAQAC